MNMCGKEVSNSSLSTTTTRDTKQNELVLVVSNDPGDGRMVSGLLSRAGYHSEVRFISSTNPNEMFSDRFASDRYVASVVCYRTGEEKRHSFQIPLLSSGQRIIVLSDCESEQVVVSMLERGAHHVIDLRQSGFLLQVRVEAALHQHCRSTNLSLSLGDIHFDVSNQQVKRAGKPVDLSRKEYQLAYYLFSNRNRIVLDRELMTSVWSLPTGICTRRISTAASRLRKKLGLSAQHGWELRRLRNTGFQLVSFDVKQDSESERYNNALQAVAC